MRPAGATVYTAPTGAVVANRRLVLKQLPGGQFALTVQSLDPISGSFVISSSQAADTSTCNMTVSSSGEADMSDNRVCHSR